MDKIIKSIGIIGVVIIAICCIEPTPTKDDVIECITIILSIILSTIGIILGVIIIIAIIVILLLVLIGYGLKAQNEIENTWTSYEDLKRLHEAQINNSNEVENK